MADIFEPLCFVSILFLSSREELRNSGDERLPANDNHTPPV
jgi:hypothetical protein